MPVTSYAPELIQFYVQASKAKLRITLPTAKAAIAFRARCHNLRRDMRKERHPLTNLANGVQIKLIDNVAIGSPADDTYLSALQNAGIGTPKSVSDLPPAPTQLDAGDDQIRDALSGFFNTEDKA